MADGALTDDGLSRSNPLAGPEGLALCRMAIGAGLILVPRVILGPWLGPDVASPGARWLARAMGGRDVALGLGLLLAARHDGPVRGWLEAGMLADATDAVAGLLAVRRLPRAGGLVIAAAALAGVVAGRRVISSLPSASTGGS